jgi:serine/threonine-protein kinase RsbW
VTVTDGPQRDSHADWALLRINAGPLSGPVLCRVVSMMLTRAGCPLDHLDDAMLVCDALCAHAPSHVSDGHLTLGVSVRPDGLELRVAELPRQQAQGLIQDSVLPGVGNVLERMASELRVEPSSSGDTEELVLSLSFV